MFGGLSIKGDAKEESAPAPTAAAATPAPASSGFSFLQSSIGASPTPAPAAALPSGAASTATSNDDTADKSEPQSQVPDSSSSSSLGGMAGSAFGFMSGAGSAIASSSVGGREEETAAPPQTKTTPAVAPETTTAQPSMFAGLITASSAKETAAIASEPAAVAAAPSGSGFSFLSAASPAAPQPPTAVSESSSEPTAPSVDSGFSFLSAPSAPVPAPTALATESSNNGDVASTTSTAGSSFSFMASMTGSELTENGTGEATNLVAVQEKQQIAAPPVNASAGSGAGGSSGFSFLSSVAHTSTAAPAPPPSEAATNPAIMDQPTSLISEGAKLETVTTSTSTSTSAPSVKAPADLFSTSNPGLPAGSGVSWSAPPVGASKKVVKKKRGKRVGVGSASTANTAGAERPGPNSVSEPPSSRFQPPSVPGNGDPVTPRAAANGHPPSDPRAAPPMMPDALTPIARAGAGQPITPMRIQAERAMDKADEFIRDKQRKSAIAMAAERAMHDRSSSAGGGAGGVVGAMDSHPVSPSDETYRAAAAAAEEAQKLATDHASHSKGKGKGSLFSNFFHRKGGGSNSSNHSISSRSSHGGVVASPAPTKGFERSVSNGSGGGLPPMQETMEIASYGDPRPAESEISTVSMRPSGASEEDESEELEEAQIRLEIQQQQQQQQREKEIRESAAVEAEIRRRKEERQRREQEEEEERLRKAEEERLRRSSPRQKMQSIIDHLADATRSSTDNVTILRARRTEMVKERARLEKAERYAEQQRDVAETQQTAAAEDEDFESADRLAGVIEKHSREKEEHSIMCKRINESIIQLDKEKEAASKAVSVCFNSAHTQLKALEKEADDRSKEKGVLDQFATTSKRLSNETERLANDLKHIERDEEVWKEESKELTGQIEEETKEFAEKCTEASSKLEEVNKTIEDLRKQLAEAQSEASELIAEISTHTQSVDKIRSKYSRQLGRLEKKEQSVKESRWDWESEKESIEKARSAHEAVVVAHSEDMLSREKLIEDIKLECSVAKDYEEIVSCAFAYVSTDEKNSSSDLESEVLKYEAAVNEAASNVVAAETNIKNIKEELSAIEVRVPILEAEKKMAAGKRDFKAAGKASKEIKQASARKEQCVVALKGEAMECVEFAKVELQKVTALLEEKKTIATEKSKEAGIELMGLLRSKIEELKSIRQRFATPESEKFGSESWGEDEEDSITVACVGAFIIESQILVLEAEGKSLGEKYGGWDSSDDVVEDTSVQSAPTFDSADDENDSEIVIDKNVLEKYISMRNEMNELDGAIEEAAEQEDFEKAAELEDRSQLVREQFEAAGFMTKKFERALKGFTSKRSATVTAADSAGNGENSPKKVINDSVLEKYASLCADIKELEASIETAVANDDFDEAAELEEKIQSAHSDIDSLGFSVEELEAALKNSSDTAADDDDNAGNIDSSSETKDRGEAENDAHEKVKENDSSSSDGGEKEECINLSNGDDVEMNENFSKEEKTTVDVGNEDG